MNDMAANLINVKDMESSGMLMYFGVVLVILTLLVSVLGELCDCD